MSDRLAAWHQALQTHGIVPHAFTWDADMKRVTNLALTLHGKVYAFYESTDHRCVLVSDGQWLVELTPTWRASPDPDRRPRQLPHPADVLKELLTWVDHQL